jgi:hypothetical protein
VQRRYEHIRKKVQAMTEIDLETRMNECDLSDSCRLLCFETLQRSVPRDMVRRYIHVLLYRFWLLPIR